MSASTTPPATTEATCPAHRGISSLFFTGYNGSAASTSYGGGVIGSIIGGSLNALFAGIDTEHLDPHDIADLQHFPRVLDEFIADLGNMDQPVLVDAQVYECAEINDVAHGASQLHAGFEVVQPHDVTAQQRLGQAVAHVAARLTQLGNDIVQRRLSHPQRLTQGLGPLGLDSAGQARQLVGADLGGAGQRQGLGRAARRTRPRPESPRW